ncbi:unnamed protein product [Brachionus calyciflorus]|uniref:Uncharacterized protein n=1 Tax=Brachionus calyciflorus TaxID=104777 RepID=A0A814DWK5_9BILA|nr:unnamed protein product [Brachionus calyciflorus]
MQFSVDSIFLGLVILNRFIILPSEPIIASGLRNGEIKILNSDSFSHLYAYREHLATVLCIEYLPDKYLASGDANGTIIIWNLLNQTKHTKLIHNGSVRSLILINDTTFATAASNSIKLWSIESFNNTLTIENAHSSNIIGLKYFFNNLFSISSDGILKSWENFVLKFQIYTQCIVSSFDIDSNGNIACGCKNGYIKIYSTDSNSLYLQDSFYFQYSFFICLERFLFKHDDLSSLRFLVDGFLVSGGMDGSLNIWNYKKRSILSYYCGHAAIVTTLEYIGNNIFISGAIGGSIKIWNMSNRTLIKAYSAGSGVSFLKLIDRKLLSSLNKNL